MSKETIYSLNDDGIMTPVACLERANKNQRANTLLLDWIASSGLADPGAVYQVLTNTSDRYKAVQKLTGEPVSE